MLFITLTSNWRSFAAVTNLLVTLVTSGCAGEGASENRTVSSIFFQTTTVRDGGAGQLNQHTITFGTTSGAPLPDRFELDSNPLSNGDRPVQKRC